MSDSKPPRDRALSRVLADAISSPVTTTLIAMIFMCAPALFALTPGRQISASPASIAFAHCDSRHLVAENDTLASLSVRYFGDVRYSTAILLATNMKGGALPYRFISRPLHLEVGSTVCLPNQRDADTLRERYEAYLNAGHAAMMAESEPPPEPLVALESGKPVTLVSWVRNDELAEYRSAKAAPRDLWVTVVPHLKDFCRDYAAEHEPEPEELSLRLEQRLGLPPGANKAAFVEFTLQNPNAFDRKTLFRPCGDPRTNTTVCNTEAEPAFDQIKPPDLPQRYWFLQKYHESYAHSEPYQYPWTGAGYTFDWATHGGGDQEFVRWGESEFVVPKGAPIIVRWVADTVAYCTP